MNNKTKHTLRCLLVLAIPTVIEEILSTLLQYVDTAMVGRLSPQATAAVNVTTTISWLTGSMFSAIGVSILALLSKAEGAGDYKKLKLVSKQAFFLATLAGLIIGAVCLAISPFVATWMRADEDIRGAAGQYFMIISIPMLFRAATSIYGSSLRAVKDAKTPLYITLLCNGLNVILNYLLIYKCNLGVTGAAIATAVSYTLMGTLMFIAYRKNEKLSYSFKEFSVDVPILKECVEVGTPVMLTSITSCLGYVVFAALVSDMGTITFAAHSIAVTAETIFYIAGYGLRVATSTLVGNSIGAKDEEELHSVTKVSMVVTVLMMTFSGIVLYIVAGGLMGLLSKDSQVINLGAQMLRLVAFSEPFFGLMIVSEGIYYGQGKTRYPFIVETFCMWGIRIACTYVVTCKLGLGLREVWFCMIADNVVKAIVLAVPIIAGLRKKTCNG